MEEKTEQLKFGDIVVNEWAGQHNPHRVLMVRMVTSGRVYCIAPDGSDTWFNRDTRLRLLRIGRVGFGTWKALQEYWATQPTIEVPEKYRQSLNPNL